MDEWMRWWLTNPVPYALSMVAIMFPCGIFIGWECGRRTRTEKLETKLRQTEADLRAITRTIQIVSGVQDVPPWKSIEQMAGGRDA